MLKADAWPYPVYREVRCELESAKYNNVDLKVESTSSGYVIVGYHLRDRSHGTISLAFRIKTSVTEVADAILDVKDKKIVTGVRILCKDSKFRTFLYTNADQIVSAEIPLERVYGVVEINPFMVLEENAVAKNDLSLQIGTIIGISEHPIFLTIDEDWFGETIPVNWMNFETNNLPAEALIHIEFSGGSQVPKVWLNSKFENHIKPVLLRKGDASAVGLAGMGMRELFWLQVWEKVLVWAVGNELEAEKKWPATRIANYWRSQFRRNGWALPSMDQMDAEVLNEMSFRIQHCLYTGQKLARVHEILPLQPEVAGAT